MFKNRHPARLNRYSIDFSQTQKEGATKKNIHLVMTKSYI